MVCPDTLNLDLPIPEDLEFERFYELYPQTDYGRAEQEEEEHVRRSALRRKMLRIARETCPSTRNRRRRTTSEIRRWSNPFRVTAYHEAGHAVAAAAFGRPLKRAGVLSRDQALVHLHPDQEGFFGRPECQGLVEMDHNLTDYEASLEGAFLAACGPAAELLVDSSASSFFLEEDERRGDDASQMFVACRHAVALQFEIDGRFPGDTDLIVRLHDQIWSLACRFVADHRAIRAIEAVAVHLRDYGSIRGTEIAWIADRYDVRGIPEIEALRRVRIERCRDAA